MNDETSSSAPEAVESPVRRGVDRRIAGSSREQSSIDRRKSDRRSRQPGFAGLLHDIIDG